MSQRNVELAMQLRAFALAFRGATGERDLARLNELVADFMPIAMEAADLLWPVPPEALAEVERVSKELKGVTDPAEQERIVKEAQERLREFRQE